MQREKGNTDLGDETDIWEWILQILYSHDGVDVAPPIRILLLAFIIVFKNRHVERAEIMVEPISNLDQISIYTKNNFDLIDKSQQHWVETQSFRIGKTTPVLDFQFLGF